MPLRSDWSQEACPIARSLDVVGDPWVVLILREAFRNATRFEQFRDRLGIADNVLSRRLAGMVEAGVLARSPYNDGGRTRQGYVLTEAGADLLPVLNALAGWGGRHTTAPEHGGEFQIVHLGCGAATTSSDTCSGCGEALAPESVAWRRMWRNESLRPLVGAARSEA